MLKATNLSHPVQIKNPAFQEYAGIYRDIEQDFLRQISAFGLPVSAGSFLDPYSKATRDIAKKGLVIANDHKSLSVGWVSPSCLTCRRGMGTATFLISLKCPRNCYFCFNPNQKDYDYYRENKRDLISELDTCAQKGVLFQDLALTGGEPLLHKPETESFFRHAKTLFPTAYTRLYTCGDLLDKSFLQTLNDAGLDEIRFSIKPDDGAAQQQLMLDKIAQSKEFIPQVMVEMPVLPDQLAEMKKLLLALDQIGIAGVNLLEFCFPYHHAEEFAKRRYEIKPTPYRVLYNYWYAGGLPVAGSEENCLHLLDFALDQNLTLGVHYCSLENKFSGQIYRQNLADRHAYPCCVMSEKDYFLKSAKVFGRDIDSVRRFLRKSGLKTYRLDQDSDYLEFPVAYLTPLKTPFPDLEVGICYHVVEQEEGESILRELRVDYTTPLLVNLQRDI